MSGYAIETVGLTKKFGDITAVNNLSLQIPFRQVFGLLGPNGAGKTTTLKMLCTILKQSSGSALVDGFDIDSKPDSVRKSIGIVFQEPSIDDKLTGRENLEIHSALYGVPRSEVKKRINEVLSLVELEDKAGKLMRTYSGGMRRRLELARGLLHYPKILFLDEPTIGLDPQTRKHIWEYIRGLIQRERITVVLTTHYMEEADELCDRIGIIDYGKIIALDTPLNLKRTIGGDVITAEVSDPVKLAAELKKHDPAISVTVLENHVKVAIPEGDKFIPRIIRITHALGLHVESVSVVKPTLNDVFLTYTGHEIREEASKGMSTIAMARRRKIK